MLSCLPLLDIRLAKAAQSMSQKDSKSNKIWWVLSLLVAVAVFSFIFLGHSGNKIIVEEIAVQILEERGYSVESVEYKGDVVDVLVAGANSHCLLQGNVTFVGDQVFVEYSFAQMLKLLPCSTE